MGEPANLVLKLFRRRHAYRRVLLPGLGQWIGPRIAQKTDVVGEVGG
jgi:hypothetical protein